MAEFSNFLSLWHPRKEPFSYYSKECIASERPCLELWRVENVENRGQVLKLRVTSLY